MLFFKVIKGNLETLGSDCKFGHGNMARGGGGGVEEKETWTKAVYPFTFQEYKVAMQTDSKEQWP